MHDSWECNDMCSLDWKQMHPKRVSPLLQMILECKTVSPWSFLNLSSHQVVLESLVPATQSASRQNSIPAELRQWAYPLTQTWGYGDGSRSRVNGVHLPLSDNINARYDDTQNHLAMARHASCILCPVSWLQRLQVLELKEALWRRSKTWAPCWQRLIAEREVTDTEALTCH